MHILLIKDQIINKVFIIVYYTKLSSIIKNNNVN